MSFARQNDVGRRSVGDGSSLAVLVHFALTWTQKAFLTRLDSLPKSRTGQKEAGFRLERILTVIVGVQVTATVSDAQLFAGKFIYDASNEVDKVVRGNISSVGDTAGALRLT